MILDILYLNYLIIIIRLHFPLTKIYFEAYYIGIA